MSEQIKRAPEYTEFDAQNFDDLISGQLSMQEFCEQCEQHAPIPEVDIGESFNVHSVQRLHLPRHRTNALAIFKVFNGELPESYTEDAWTPYSPGGYKMDNRDSDFYERQEKLRDIDRRQLNQTTVGERNLGFFVASLFMEDVPADIHQRIWEQNSEWLKTLLNLNLQIHFPNSEVSALEAGAHINYSPYIPEQNIVKPAWWVSFRPLDTPPLPTTPHGKQPRPGDPILPPGQNIKIHDRDRDRLKEATAQFIYREDTD